MRWSWVVLGCVLPAACGEPAVPPLTLTAQDSAAIAEVHAAYVRAWLADDTAGVLATLDPAAVLLPPGRTPITGHPAIRAYWWPEDGSHTTIQRFTWEPAELAATSGLAYTRGLSTVAWRYEKDSTRSEQISRNQSLTVFARGPDGKWRIVRQMWGPSLPG